MLAFSNDYYGFIFRATQSVELFCAYYLKGTSYPKLSKEYQVAKSTLVGWVKKYSEECQSTKPQTSPSFSENAKEIHELHKRIQELEKENLFLKKAAAFFAKEID